MITTGKIIHYDNNQILIAPDEKIGREILKKNIENIEIRLNDGRTISSDQRKKIFALIRDIAIWSGHEPEYLRQLLTWDFVCKKDIEWFSLSDVDMTTAKEYITYLIEFCFYFGIPTKDTMLNYTDDIGKYLYLCLEYKRCAICNSHGEIHHVDRVGMGFDREKIVHKGLKAMCLCRRHHIKAHEDEKTLFKENHIYGIRLDDYLCSILRLNTKVRR